MIKNIIIGVVVLVLIVAGALAYFLFRPPEEASAPIEAIPLQLDETETSEEAVVEAETDIEAETAEESDLQEEPVVETEVTEEQVEAEAEAVEESELQTEAAVEAEVAEEQVEVEAEVVEGSDAVEEETATETEVVEESEAQAEVVAEAETSETESNELLIYEIIPAQSEARFLIDEVLRGDPVTVVGVTDQVAGQVAFDFSNPSTSQVGVIQVNARTLVTDNEFRNRAIKNAILLTDDYEFVTFTPTEIIGLPESAAIGETYNFQMIGDLAVTDVTREVTFEVSATAVSETQLQGMASTSVLYTDYELFIPDSPSVDTIDDAVRLEIDFVAEVISTTG